MQIHAKTPKGRRYHGRLDFGGVFSRNLDGRYVRWFDRSFCINTSVIPKLKEKDCKVLQFIYLGKTGKFIYRIGFEQALEVGKVKTNEHGEENLRIPIDECRMVKKITLEGEAVKPAEDEKKIKQLKLL